MSELYSYIRVTHKGCSENGSVMVSPIGSTKDDVRFPVEASHIYSEQRIAYENDNTKEKQKVREAMFYLNGIVSMLLISENKRERDIANNMLFAVNKILNSHKEDYYLRMLSTFKKGADDND